MTSNGLPLPYVTSGRVLTLTAIFLSISSATTLVCLSWTASSWVAVIIVKSNVRHKVDLSKVMSNTKGRKHIQNSVVPACSIVLCHVSGGDAKLF